MFRMRPKRPILRAQLAAANPYGSGSTLTQQLVRQRHTGPMTLTSGSGKPGEVCWWTGPPDYAKCCSYDGIAIPFCVTYPDVGDD